MKLQELLVPLILSIVTVWGMNYFFGDKIKTSEEQNNAKFVAAEVQRAQALPLQKTVQFENGERLEQAIVTVVDTAWGEIAFSSHGGVVEYIEYNRVIDRQIPPTRTVFPVSREQQGSAAFLLALEQNTPLAYQLTRHEVRDAYTTLEYQAKNQEALITKKFTAHHKTHQIDLELTIASRSEKTPLHFVRLILPAPQLVAPNMGTFTPGYAADTSISVLIKDRNGSVERKVVDQFMMKEGWIKPTTIGFEDSYFTNILYADRANFISRAYLVSDQKHPVAVLETGDILQETTSSFSFYCGPKEQEALGAVDSDLQLLFGFQGIFAPFTALLSMLLKFLYKLCGSVGGAIILLTFFVRLLLLPLTWYGERTTKEQREFEKKMQYLTQKYKNDAGRLQLERAELIKHQGLSFLGVGILVFLIQIPLFICLNRVLGASIELFSAPFLWIPDLAGYDPFYVLPVLIGGTVSLQSASAMDAKKRITAILFALLIGALATRFSAGFGLYFLISSLLAMAQTALMRRLSTPARI